MNQLTELLKKIEPGDEYLLRKMNLITQMVHLDKRFLPLVASELYAEAVEKFWSSAPEPLELMGLVSPPQLEPVESPEYLANIVIEQITTFIKVNGVILDDNIDRIPF